MKIVTKLISDDNTFHNVIDGVLDGNLLKYQENGIEVTFDIEHNDLSRESDGFLMKYSFIEGQETVNNIYIKDIGKSVDIAIQTNFINKEDGIIDIEYRLVDDDSVIRYLINYGG